MGSKTLDIIGNSEIAEIRALYSLILIILRSVNPDRIRLFTNSRVIENITHIHATRLGILVEYNPIEKHTTSPDPYRITMVHNAGPETDHAPAKAAHASLTRQLSPRDFRNQVITSHTFDNNLYSYIRYDRVVISPQ